MSISFNEVPNNIHVPFVSIEFDNSKALPGSRLQTYRCLVIGQKLPQGKQPAEVPIRIARTSDAADYFGEGSMLHAMCEKLMDNNSFAETWAVALDDAPQGVAAAGKITIQTNDVSAGTCYLYIAGHRLMIGIHANEDAKTIASRLVQTINSETTLPITATINVSDNTQIDLTAKHRRRSG